MKARAFFFAFFVGASIGAVYGGYVHKVAWPFAAALLLWLAAWLFV